MNYKLKYWICRKLAPVVAFIFLLQVFTPKSSLALTGGPGQPEFSSFEPVSTTQMVDPFTGDFTYNLPVLEIPGAQGGGYALSLSYHSGASPEEEASWVGYGWTLNPGAINRQKRGFPDEYKGDMIEYWNKTPKNWTASISRGLGFEIFSYDVGVNLNASLRYNNYKGFGYTAGIGTHYASGTVSLGYSVTDGEGSWSASVNPAQGITKAIRGSGDDENNPSLKSSIGRDYVNYAVGKSSFSLVGSKYGFFTRGEGMRKMNFPKYKGAAYNLSVGVMGTVIPAQLGITADITGHYSWQNNIDQTDQEAFGYMYSGHAGSDDMMDYYVENNTPYQKRDRVMGIPFHNADNFAVTGEGIGGGFRLYNKEPGHFRPNSQSSSRTIFNIGAEIEAGQDFGGGGDIGDGHQEMRITTWPDEGNTGNYEFAKPTGRDKNTFFRFNNDLGGKAVQAPDEGTFAASLNTLNSFPPGTKKVEPDIPSSEVHTLNQGNRSERSSYIAYHTNEEMEKTNGSNKYYPYSRASSTESMVDRSDNAISDGIGELVVFNEEGTRYTYGLPVYSRNEYNMQYGLQGTPSENIKYNYLAYRDISNENDLELKVGEKRSTPYARSFLLTSITTPDYVDRENDGPTRDDFGGYTKFGYDRPYGSDDKSSGSGWYNWRVPYTGLLYQRKAMSDPTDDAGTVTGGEKEMYYLDSIVTKTHIAKFYTSDRDDGRGAADNVTAAKDSTASTSQSLKKLDSIRLFALDENGEPGELQKTVHFEYDYSLASNVPNNVNSNGKLTLKKVWFEYECIRNARISPYEFGYQYKSSSYYNDLPTDLQNKYSDIINYASNFSNENPDYDPVEIDPWGNYQSEGKSRHADMMPWVDQDPPDDFDPAAWQLKAIELPSGGEIHVHYEQDDYFYVQDKQVRGLVSLTDDSSVDDDKYYLNINDLPDDVTENEVADLIKEKVVNEDKKIFFRFLYTLLGSDPPSLGDCNAEYITGYADVKQVGTDANGVFVELGGSGNDYELPENACEDFFVKNAAGKNVLEDGCDATDDGVSNNGNAKDVLMGFLSFLAQFSPYSLTCGEINDSKSYLRIPLPRAKKGGGVRVKRLLMFDKGIESGDGSLYGEEYIYETEHDSREGEVISSGVATNEPSSVKDDHTLHHFIERFEQSWGSKLIAGKDKKQMEGPVGKSILPAPSVGYRKVIIKNIHEERTNPGYEVKEFHTAYNHPVESNFTPLTDDNKQKDWMMLPLGLVNISISNMWLTQGFSFVFNDMHGKQKRMVKYGTTDFDDLHNPEPRFKSFEKQFTYTEPGEKIPMLYGADSTVQEVPGTEREVIFEIKGVEEVADDKNLEFDADVGLAGFIPIPYLTAFPSVSFTESKLRKHATTKITRYASVLEKTETYKDGITHIKEHKAFDPATAKPVITKSYDAFHDNSMQQSNNHTGTYHTYNYPAHERYEALGERALSERRMIRTDTISIDMVNGEYLEFSSSSGTVCDAMNTLTPGDLVMLYNGTSSGIYHTGEVTGGNKVNIFNHSFFGTANDGDIDSIEIIKSGRSNELSKKAGKIVTYGQETLSLDSTYNGIDNDLLDDREAIANSYTNVVNGGEFQPADSTGDDIYMPNLNTCGCCIRVDGTVICDECDSTWLGIKNETNQLRVFVRYNDDTLCKSIVDKTTEGYFEVDKATGKLLYYNDDNPCIPQKLDCPQFCPGVNAFATVDKVLDASARTFDHHWPYDDTIYDVSLTNPYEKGEKGKWRQQEKYAYKTDIIDAVTGTERIYKDAGVFEQFTLFNWDKVHLNDTTKWLKQNTVTRYSPNGEPIEERNILGVNSAAKFGYQGTKPFLVAQNAGYDEVQFVSFEKTYSFSNISGTYLEDGLELDLSQAELIDTTAHSGHQCIRLKDNGGLPLKESHVSEQVADEGITVKLWLRQEYSTITSPVEDHLKLHFPNTGPSDVPFQKVAQTGQWSLYEATTEGFGTAGDTYDLEVKYDFPNGVEILWLDDIRVQPRSTKMTAYVYDVNSLRLAASFDDQHFGLYYQYDSEGKLVRKIKETERGFKTIKETQYHTPLESRN
jgi:hypothetical protein